MKSSTIRTCYHLEADIFDERDMYYHRSAKAITLSLSDNLPIQL